MIRSLAFAAMLALAGTSAFAATSTLACASAEEATARFDRALAAYFAVSAGLAPEEHTAWSDTLRRYQSAVARGDYGGACAALDEGSAEIGI